MCDVSCLSDVLATDKQLASEIEFDLRKFEEQEKERQKQRKSSNVVVSFLSYMQDLSTVSESCVDEMSGEWFILLSRDLIVMLTIAVLVAEATLRL